MLYKNFFSRDIFSELERMQQEFDRTLGLSPSIRGSSRGYPAMNIGTTPQSVEIYVFVPGMQPADIQVELENGTLSVAGERKTNEAPQGATKHIQERFTGRFRRVISLPDDVDPNQISALCRDGVLHVRIGRKEAMQPRRISVQ